MCFGDVMAFLSISSKLPTISRGWIEHMGELIETGTLDIGDGGRHLPVEVEDLLNKKKGFYDENSFQTKTQLEILAAIGKRFSPKPKPLISAVIGEPDFLPFNNLSIGQKLGSAVCRITKPFETEKDAEKFLKDIKKFSQDLIDKNIIGKGGLSPLDIASLFPVRASDEFLEDFLLKVESLDDITAKQIEALFYDVCATGFLVSRNYLLTNYHVFSGLSDSDTANATDPNDLSDHGFFAEFGYEVDSFGRAVEPIKYPLKKILLYDDINSLDYALVELDTSEKISVQGESISPGDMFGWIQLLDDPTVVSPAIEKDDKDNRVGKIFTQLSKITESLDDFRFELVRNYTNKNNYRINIIKTDGEIVFDRRISGSLLPKSVTDQFASSSKVEIQDNDIKQGVLSFLLGMDLSKVPHVIDLLDEPLRTRGQYGDSINIIQHPRGRRKEIVTSSNRLKKMNKNYLQYTADIDFSSSGSPVFNQQWQLVGLHQSAIAEVATQKGGFLFLIELEQGIRTCRIVEDIRQKILDMVANVIEKEENDIIPLLSFFNSFVSSDGIDISSLNLNQQQIQELTQPTIIFPSTPSPMSYPILQRSPELQIQPLQPTLRRELNISEPLLRRRIFPSPQ